MDLSKLKPTNYKPKKKRIGRGGNRGTFSGKGSKGQKSRAGAGVKPGFRGGDNRIWQLFPKQRGASKKPGNSSPHHKHRFFSYKKGKMAVLNLEYFNKFKDGQVISPEKLNESGMSSKDISSGIKILGGGELKKKIIFEGFRFSKSAQSKVLRMGGTIK